MNTDAKNDDLQALAKEQVRLTKWLLFTVVFQSVFVVTSLGIVLWMFIAPLLIGSRHY